MNRRLFLTGAASTALVSTAYLPGATSRADGVTDIELGAAIRQESSIGKSLDRAIEQSRFSGTALITRSSESLLFKGYGQADQNFHVLCGQETRYRIASITKLFTSTMVLQLVQEKKLNLDKTIGTYLPMYAGAAKDKATIRQLLHHTSGIENFDRGLTSYAQAAQAGIPAYQMPHTSDELLARFASGPLIHEPGAVFDYNNADFVILGKIIEAVEAATFDRLLQRRIIEPLKLQSTGIFPQRVIQKNLASTYYADDGQPIVNDFPVYPENWYAAGGMMSSASDLLVFSRALFGGSLLSSDSLKTLLTPGLEDYGCGLWIATLDVNGRKYRFAQRPGRIMGANTLLLQFLDDSLNIILLGNTNLTDTDNLGFALAKQVLAI